MTQAEMDLRATQLEGMLEGVANPLRNAINHSYHALLTPYEWFYVASPPAYSQQSRCFAAQMKLTDPILLGAFARADLNALLR